MSISDFYWIKDEKYEWVLAKIIEINDDILKCEIQMNNQTQKNESDNKLIRQINKHEIMLKANLFSLNSNDNYNIFNNSQEIINDLRIKFFTFLNKKNNDDNNSKISFSKLSDRVIINIIPNDSANDFIFNENKNNDNIIKEKDKFFFFSYIKNNNITVDVDINIQESFVENILNRMLLNKKDENIVFLGNKISSKSYNFKEINNSICKRFCNNELIKKIEASFKILELFGSIQYNNHYYNQLYITLKYSFNKKYSLNEISIKTDLIELIPLFRTCENLEDEVFKINESFQNLLLTKIFVSICLSNSKSYENLINEHNIDCNQIKDVLNIRNISNINEDYCNNLDEIFKLLSFSEGHINFIYKTLLGILLLSQTRFENLEFNEHVVVAENSKKDFYIALKLLDIGEKEIMRFLNFDNFKKDSLSLERDSNTILSSSEDNKYYLIKYIYSAVFNYIVEKINLDLKIHLNQKNKNFTFSDNKKSKLKKNQSCNKFSADNYNSYLSQSFKVNKNDHLNHLKHDNLTEFNKNCFKVDFNLSLHDYSGFDIINSSFNGLLINNLNEYFLNKFKEKILVEPIEELIKEEIDINADIKIENDYSTEVILDKKDGLLNFIHQKINSNENIKDSSILSNYLYENFLNMNKGNLKEVFQNFINMRHNYGDVIYDIGGFISENQVFYPTKKPNEISTNLDYFNINNQNENLNLTEKVKLIPDLIYKNNSKLSALLKSFNNSNSYSYENLSKKFINLIISLDSLFDSEFNSFNFVISISPFKDFNSNNNNINSFNYYSVQNQINTYNILEILKIEKEHSYFCLYTFKEFYDKYFHLSKLLILRKKFTFLLVNNICIYNQNENDNVTNDDLNQKHQIKVKNKLTESLNISFSNSNILSNFHEVLQEEDYLEFCIEFFNILSNKDDFKQYFEEEININHFNFGKSKIFISKNLYFNLHNYNLILNKILFIQMKFRQKQIRNNFIVRRKCAMIIKNSFKKWKYRRMMKLFRLIEKMYVIKTNRLNQYKSCFLNNLKNNFINTSDKFYVNKEIFDSYSHNESIKNNGKLLINKQKINEINDDTNVNYSIFTYKNKSKSNLYLELDKIDENFIATNDETNINNKIQFPKTCKNNDINHKEFKNINRSQIKKLVSEVKTIKNSIVLDQNIIGINLSNNFFNNEPQIITDDSENYNKCINSKDEIYIKEQNLLLKKEKENLISQIKLYKKKYEDCILENEILGEKLKLLKSNLDENKNSNLNPINIEISNLSQDSSNNIIFKDLKDQLLNKDLKIVELIQNNSDLNEEIDKLKSIKNEKCKFFLENLIIYRFEENILNEKIKNLKVPSFNNNHNVNEEIFSIIVEPKKAFKFLEFNHSNYEILSDNKIRTELLNSNIEILNNSNNIISCNDQFSFNKSICINENLINGLNAKIILDKSKCFEIEKNTFFSFLFESFNTSKISSINNNTSSNKDLNIDLRPIKDKLSDKRYNCESYIINEEEKDLNEFIEFLKLEIEDRNQMIKNLHRLINLLSVKKYTKCDLELNKNQPKENKLKLVKYLFSEFSNKFLFSLFRTNNTSEISLNQIEYENEFIIKFINDTHSFLEQIFTNFQL